MKDYEAGEMCHPVHVEQTFCSLLVVPLNFFFPPPLFSLTPISLGQLYGLEKFWAFLKYSKAKNLEIDPKLQGYLSKFKRLEDFRVDVSMMVASLLLGFELFSLSFQVISRCGRKTPLVCCAPPGHQDFVP